MSEKKGPDERLKGKPENKAKSKPEKKGKEKPQKKARHASPKRGPDIARIAFLSTRMLLPAVLLFVAFLILLATVSSRIAYHPSVSQGITVGNWDFSGVAPQDLPLFLKETVSEPNTESVITVQTEGWQVQRTFGELGVRIDWEELQQRVLSPGHEGGLLRRTMERITLRRTPLSVEIPVRFDTEKADTLIKEVYQQFHRPATGATLELKTEEVVLHSGADGETIDIPTLASRLLSVMETRQSGVVRIPRRTLPSPPLEVAPLLKSILRDPRNAAIKRNPDGTNTLVRSHTGRMLTEERLQTEIQRLESRTDRRSVSRVLPVTFTQPEITEEDLAQEMEDAGLSVNTQSPPTAGRTETSGFTHLPHLSKTVTSLAASGKHVVSQFHTDIPTRTDLDLARIVNITLAAEAVNGLILQPGETFSFNGVTGRRTRSKGYVDAPAYAEGRVILDVGGGICQVSTTLFNAALLAGLEPVERHNHMFTVSYAAPGRDASVSYGSQDLRLRNPYSIPVQFRVAVKDTVLLAEIILPQETQPERITLYTRTTSVIPSGKHATTKSVWTDLATTEPDIGLNGAVVETWRQSYTGGNLLKEERLYVSRYAPFPTDNPPPSLIAATLPEEDA